MSSLDVDVSPTEGGEDLSAPLPAGRTAESALVSRKYCASAAASASAAAAAAAPNFLVFLYDVDDVVHARVSAVEWGLPSGTVEHPLPAPREPRPRRRLASANKATEDLMLCPTSRRREKSTGPKNEGAARVADVIDKNRYNT